MGFAGNAEPSFIIPTVIASHSGNVNKGLNKAAATGIEDLDFHIGDDALKNSKVYGINYPVRKGQVDNWTHMEQVWQHCIFKYLR